MNCTAEALTFGDLTMLNIVYVLLKCYEFMHYLAAFDWSYVLFWVVATLGALRIVGWLIPTRKRRH